MKRLLSYLFGVCALAALVFTIYRAVPIFPYLNDIEVAAGGILFLFFYYLAYITSKSKKKRELT